MSRYSAKRRKSKAAKPSLDEQLTLAQFDFEDEDELDDEAADAALKWVDYICLPNALLQHPYAVASIGVFTFSVAGGVMQLARGDGPYGKARHDDALAAGRTNIGLHRVHVARRDAKVEKTKSSRVYRKLMHKGFSHKGKLGYARARESFALKEPLTLTVSSAALLRATGKNANQSNKGGHLHKLDAALERLRKPIIKQLPPLIEDYSFLKDGKLKLRLHEAWFPPNQFAMVFWPPPKVGGGATVLALYLFLFLFSHNQGNGDRYIPLPSLYKQLGLADLRPAHAFRTLEHALAAVNQHLAKSERILQAHNNCNEESRHIPEQFEMIRVRRGVQFRAVYHDVDGYQEAAE